MMSAIRRVFALATAVAFALVLGACGGGGACGDRSTAADCPPSPSPPIATPTPFATPTPIATPTPAALDVTGSWRSLARSWNFNLKQDGSTLSGVVVGFKNISYPATDPTVQINGTIDSSGNVAFSAAVFGIEFNGVAEPGGLRITGTLRDCAGGCRNYGEILEKQ